MTNLITLKHGLVDAEIALHKLMTGEQEVTVSVDGYGATTYAQAQTEQLRAYISQLESKIAKTEGRPKRGPLWIRF